MTDTLLLKKKIKESGLKLQFIADKLGISRQSLSYKINNLRGFNQYEMEILKELLSIDTYEEFKAIFFKPDVD